MLINVNVKQSHLIVTSLAYELVADASRLDSIDQIENNLCIANRRILEAENKRF